ncbi:MAG TPA: rRNA maturation RNase YbeY [Caulobacteraceae bacterium]|nr:rRNA maturation RNase YbeY [Caulobacteraceae bacterium]
MNAVAIEVEDEAWTEALADAEAIVERAALAALSSLPPGEIEISVLLTDDATIRALNARFRDKDAATNVLSFPAPAFARPHLGDLALAFGTCAAEAKAQDKTLADHLSHLTVHGVLHLLGYDHEADEEAEVMEQMERTILKTLGVSDPYALGPDA